MREAACYSQGFPFLPSTPQFSHLFPGRGFPILPKHGALYTSVERLRLWRPALLRAFEFSVPFARNHPGLGYLLGPLLCFVWVSAQMSLHQSSIPWPFQSSPLYFADSLSVDILDIYTNLYGLSVSIQWTESSLRTGTLCAYLLRPQHWGQGLLFWRGSTCISWMSEEMTVVSKVRHFSSGSQQIPLLISPASL